MTRLVALALVLLVLPPDGGGQTNAPSQVPSRGGGRAASAPEWNQWRGPSRNGVIPAALTPKWPAAWKQSWRVQVGEGYASPVVSGDRVFLHSRKDPEEIITSYDAALGHIKWQHKYKTEFTKNQYAKNMSKGPFATPLVAGNTLVTVGGTGVVSAWNARTGAMLWLKDYSPSVDLSKLFTGTAASPLSEAGMIIVQVGSDIHGGRVMALDPATGAEKWTWKGPGPGYASPVAITVSGVRQIVTLTEATVEGIDAKSGAGLWSIPFPDEFHENIVTPIWTGTHLIVSGTRQGTHAYTLAQAGGAWKAAQAWKNADVAMYMSTPVLADGVLYGLSSKKRGQIVAVDAATGALKWATEGRSAEHASILLAPNHVVILTTAGELVLVKRSAAKYEEERRYTVSEGATWSPPAVLPDGFIIRDATGLMRIVGS